SVQEIKKTVSVRTKVADSVWARQRRRVKQNSAGPRELHPTQDKTSTPKPASLTESVVARLVPTNIYSPGRHPEHSRTSGGAKDLARIATNVEKQPAPLRESL